MVARHSRLRDEHDVRRVRARGKAWAAGPLVARVLPNELDPPRNRYAVVAGKKVGKAVQRNRLKRLVREAIRLTDPSLKQGFDLVVICRGTVEELPGLAEALATYRRICRRAGLLADPDSPSRSESPPDTPPAS
jgi:ribonuclease P protein component